MPATAFAPELETSGSLPEEPSADPGQEESAGPSWEALRGQVQGNMSDARSVIFLDLFQSHFAIDSAVSAFMSIKPFLSEYLVRDFDYKKFSVRLDTATEDCVEEPSAWADFVDKRLSDDFGAAAALMLRLTVVAARAFGLRTSDWADLNKACGAALRDVPACYRLQHGLPGALNDARGFRCLEMPEDFLSPWNSSEGRENFELMYDVTWEEIEEITADDTPGPPKSCFTGSLVVEDVQLAPGLALVYLRAKGVGGDPFSFVKTKAADGTPVLWELEEKLGALLRAGMVVEGDWYELPSETCFLGTLISVSPGW